MIATTEPVVKVKLAWDPPTTNADGTPLTDLAGYKVYASESPIPDDADKSTLTLVADIPKDQTTTSVEYAVKNKIGKVYFRATAYDTSGNESTFSNEASKAYDFLPPMSITIHIVPEATA